MRLEGWVLEKRREWGMGNGEWRMVLKMMENERVVIVTRLPSLMHSLRGMSGQVTSERSIMIRIEP